MKKRLNMAYDVLKKLTKLERQLQEVVKSGNKLDDVDVATFALIRKKIDRLDGIVNLYKSCDDE